MNSILVTGGTGFIGSHTVVRLIEQGFNPVIIDNLDNSSAKVLERIEGICGHRPEFIKADIRDPEALSSLFTNFNIDAVVHFAGLKAVGESVEKPMRYYSNNVQGTIELLKAMEMAGCRKLVFSSSSTVYGDPSTIPVTEDMPLSVTNPYGQSKLMIENILRDLSAADPAWQFTLLRYFNPVGAHESGQIGEQPNGIPNNLLPFIAQVAVGRLSKLRVWGNDYDTLDGTGVRDYIHVVDLADAHIKALECIQPEQGCKVFNIGTGQGYSVLQMVRAFEQASGQTIPYSIEPRRPGDIAASFADCSLAERELGWVAKRGIDDIMNDQWNWQKNNPNGYEE
ncbi:MAG: UDP-glucose 4-epimerase GalE [Acidiferrobacterales bacterium]|nr:UDP-glucose 4-epimerase GalE [Acidiferrobacterales bacterium]